MSRSATNQMELDRVAHAIADGATFGWSGDGAPACDAATLAGLQLLDDVARAFRDGRTDSAAPARAPAFRWGTFEVHEALGSGGYAEVFRAWDPWLQREVALKLAGSSAAGPSSAGLDAGSSSETFAEARRLAQVRHRNVSSVYGCATHDGRAGLWSELIEGTTLAALVARDGPLAGPEVVRIGHDLALALAVVHAAGLVHGDVKAENVMSAADGRIVLLDFGAGGDARLLASRRLLRGTPHYLAPEVLDGAPLAPSSDVYALGVLLYLLLGARLPYTADSIDALRAAQRAGPPPPLAARVPDADPRLLALIERCLAPAPERPASASALAAAFDALRPPAREQRRTMRWARTGVLTGALALLSIGALLAWPRLFPAPWRAESTFVRVQVDGSETLSSRASLRVGDRLRLRLASNRDAWVYVLNEDAAGHATVLFPLEAHATAPALRAGAALELPGGDAARTLAWEVTDDSEREEFLVVAALAPLPALDRALREWRRAARSTAGTRAVGAVGELPAAQVRGAHLREIDAQLDAREDVRTWHFLFEHTDG